MTNNEVDNETVPARSKRTVTVLGCGALGTAILSGMLASIAASTAHGSANFFAHFVACVRRQDAATVVSDRLSSFANTADVEILNGENVRGVKQADTILLACQPHLYTAILDEPGMREALRGKLIISVLAGVTTMQIESAFGGNGDHFVIRAMPNIACFVRDSATAIERPKRAFPDTLLQVTDTIFRCVGRVFYIESSVYDICTALCGSTPAFLAIIIESMVDGVVAMGLGHQDAIEMTAHTMRGAANLLLENRNPWTIRHQVASPGGSTMQGLLMLERGNVRSSISNAMIVAAEEAKKLGSKEKESK
ncbi:pyrroline-5-carboxylate reductase [Periconia macrospinosa]|uniref:Pyrroline-5-carboxylate reductase n=1 Tax=Periconia macrospinosa TaxID=97972 RepID=A0A2V1D5Z6_9PLEO|nr:pyrroline-5-carboxylate reductase [Periconia macrospinosa]